MKRILLSLLFVLATSAHAAACYPSQVGGSGTAAQLHLTPEVVGTAVTAPNGQVKRSGAVPTYLLAWHCPNPYGPPATELRWCVREFLLSCLVGGIEAAVSSRDPKATAAADALGTDLTMPMNDGVYQVVVNVVWPSRPPTPVWTVARNSTYATRPAYPLVNGVRSSTATARATVGARCNCAVRAVEGSSTYCAHEPTAATVALCMR